MLQPNNLTLPEGSLTQASNVIIQREAVIEPRRGFQLFGTPFGTVTDTLKQVFQYKSRLLRHWGTTLEFDSGTTNNAGQELFLPFDTSFTEAQVGLRTKSVESNGNFFLTSSEGIVKISASTASDFSTASGFVTPAGGIKALDLTATLDITQGSITGFLPQDSTVAYRVVWGTNDLNKNLILGVPSQRAEVYNPLSNLIILDLDNTLQQIQNVADQPAPNNSLISNTDYVSTLNLPNTATPQDIQTNLIALAAKLDNNILIANALGTAQLTISGLTIVNNSTTVTQNVATITFSAGNPANYWSAGDSILLSGFPNGEGVTNVTTANVLNGLQTIASVTPTTITFLTAVSGNTQNFNASQVSVANNNITINNHGFQNFDPVRFTNAGGALPTPLVAGTTYYIGNVSTNTFQLYSNSSLSAQVTLTGTGTGTQTVTFFFPTTGTVINSGTFTAITQPAFPDTPTPDQELVALQTYLQSIITALQNEKSTGVIPIISAYSQTNYIANLSITTTANVTLNITIPQGITSNYFFQIYRSPVTQATGVEVLSDLTASDELQQVYEAFPTAAQLAAGTITVTDIVPDSFLGADLYTNQSSGVGIANANEVPPFALDINRYKNVTFYANTRTKYRQSLQLLGVSQLIADYNMGIIPELVISDGVTTNIYSFVLGISQVTQVTTVADVANSLNGKYFLINSGNNVKQYYVWYKTSGGTAIDPAIAGATGIEVFINTGDTANTVAFNTSNAINSLAQQDFVSTVSTNVITITTNAEGYTNASTAGTSGFAVTTPTSGQGQKIQRIQGDFSTVADFAGSLAGKYFTVTSAFNKIEYYPWYRVSGIGTDPLVPNATAIPIDITINDSAATVASKTAAQLNATGNFVATNPSSNLLDVSPFTFGPGNVPTVGNSGFTLLSTTPGFLQVLLSNNPSAGEAIDETARSLVNVINLNQSESIYAFYLSQSSTVPGQMTLESRTFTSPQYYLVTNDSNVGSSFSPNLSPSIAITSITVGSPTTNLVTTASPHNLVTGSTVVISNTNSVPSADGVYTITYISPTTFRLNNTTIISPSTQGEMISGVDAVSADDEAKINRIYYSNFQQPESVPLPNTIDVGDSDKPILRIFPLRDSLFVFKEEGTYRISGETAPFTLDLFDSSCLVTAPDSVSVAKNVIYAWTTQGILNITEAGVSNPPITRPIDTVILPLGSDNYPNFTTATWGVGYESDNSYLVFTVQTAGDTVATIAYRYSTLTSCWTTFDKTNTCGLVNLTDDRLYMGAGDINFLEQERKTFTRYDYADRIVDSTLNKNLYFGNKMILSDVSGIVAGDVLTQNQLISIYDFNSLLSKLDIDPSLNTNTIIAMTTGSTPTITTNANHYLSTGNYITLTGTKTTPNIDGIYQVTVLNATQFTINVPSPVLTAVAMGVVKFDYYNNFLMSAGQDMQTSLSNLSTRLNIEPSLIYKTVNGSIVSNSIASPTILTLSAPVDLQDVGNTRIIRISGNTGSVPSINGDYVATVIDSTHVSIPVSVTTGGTGGSFTTLDDYVNSIAPRSGSITNIQVIDPTVITAPNHGMVSDRYIQISSSNSSPVIDGNYSISLIDQNSFTIDLNVLVAGTSGSFSTLTDTMQDNLDNFNYIISILNKDTGTAFKNYATVSESTIQETIINNVNNATHTITTDLALDFLVGPLVIYKAIPTIITYAPVTFQDALNLKQVSEATLMFENKQFSEATLSFASDLQPAFVPIPFSGNGNGNFGMGTGPFGGGFFGGAANAAPFRTYIPRYVQRCRYIVARFTHNVALEKYSINGLSLSGTIGESTRAYR